MRNVTSAFLLIPLVTIWTYSHFFQGIVLDGGRSERKEKGRKKEEERGGGREGG